MTGLFFGSFNPIHTGHLIVAEYMRQQANMEEVWFIVSPHNPLKEKSELAEQQLRLKMVQMAIEDNKNFKASDIEFQLPLPSYTVNTLTELNRRFPQKQFAVIMGSDNLINIHLWRNYETILNNYQLFIYRRGETEETTWKKYTGITFFDAPFIKISSTEIRSLIAKKKSVRYLVPEVVSKYIRENKLYGSE